MSEFLIVDLDFLPKIYSGVVNADELLERGEAKNTTEAAKMAGISRGVYYKYRNHVFAYSREDKSSIITIQVILIDKPGILASVLSVFNSAGANILTVNQNIPVKGKAFVTISARASDKSITTNEILERVKAVNGVIKIDSIIG
jgi:chorismate mutase